MKTLLGALLAALSVAGCSGDDFQSLYSLNHGSYEGGPTFSPEEPTGPVDAAICSVPGQAAVTGMTFVAKDAIEIFDNDNAQFVIQISDYAGSCAMAGDVHAGSNTVSLLYQTSPLSAGTYDITKTAGLSAKFAQYDTTCKTAKSGDATSGTITFAKADKCGAEGSFDLMFGSEHVTATFTASVCATNGGNGACH